jgi:maltoporin
VRYYNTDPSNIISFIANSRYPVTRNWRVNPRLQYDIRQLKNGQSRKLLRAIFRTDYRYRNDARFDFEIGYDKNSGETVGEILGSSRLFFTLGYRWDF